MNLKKHRTQIDRVDSEILDLLNRRIRLAKEIALVKEKENKTIYAPQREKKILKSLASSNKVPLPYKELVEIFREIFNACRNSEKKLNIAYLGPETTFTHQAAVKNFGKFARFISTNSISDVFNEVEKGRADYGVVPIENSTEGVINHTLDMFIDSDLKICSELLLEVSLNLVSRTSNLSRIKTIFSHPQPIAQSRKFIEEKLHHARIVECSSTSESARLASKNPNSAAIASRVTAELYKLKVVCSHIEDMSDNYTRFLIIGKEYPPRSGHDKTSILFSIKDRIGALHDMLVPFSKYKINLTKIESRPSRKKVWHYIFFVDLLGHVEDTYVKKALLELEKQCLFVKVLGSYPTGE